MNTPSNAKTKLKEWILKFKRNKLVYGVGVAIWEDIRTHPQDEFFLELGEIYLEANQDLKTDIKKLFKKPDEIWQLTLFIRRVAKMIHSDAQTDLAKIGIAIADIVAGKEDFRDVLISLAILRYRADLVGILTMELINEAELNCSAELRKLLQNFKNWSWNDIEWSIKQFGPSDWAQNP